MADSPIPAPLVEDATELARQAWQALPGINVQPIADFMREAAQHPLSPADKKKIIDQATLMFQHLYPHLPFKREKFEFSRPVEWLNRNVRPVLETIGEVDFHAHVVAAFSLIRDAHTLYGLPAPYRGAIAFLPFQMRFFMDERRITGTSSAADFEAARFIVTKVIRGFTHPHFRTGAEITRWRGFPVSNVILALSGRLPGGNQAAALTRGTLHSTLSPLTFCQPPEFDERSLETFDYIPPDSTETRTIRIPWGVATGIDAQHAFPSSSA